MVHTKTKKKKEVSLQTKSFSSYVKTESEQINSSDCKNLFIFKKASLKKKLKPLFKMKEINFRKEKYSVVWFTIGISSLFAIINSDNKFYQTLFKNYQPTPPKTN
jgi:hypothetical protein